jgi:hypothetical protein
VLAIVSHVNFNDVLILIKKPSPRIVLFANWHVIADDGSEVCHCCSPFPSLRNRLRSGSLATPSVHDSVLPQNAVGDVFQLGHNSNPRAIAPFNEIHLGFHWLTSLHLHCGPAQCKSNNNAKPKWEKWTRVCTDCDCTKIAGRRSIFSGIQAGGLGPA